MNYGTMTTSNGVFTLTADSGGRPPQSPQGLIATRAVETKNGWLGQIYVDKQIVFESAQPLTTSDEAITEAANKRVVAAVTKLFALDDA